MLAPVIASPRRLVRRAREAFARARANVALEQKITALLAALLILTGALGAGRSYLWCSMMEQAVEACCCDPTHEGDEDESAAEMRAACCEDHALGELAKARVAADVVEVPDAVVVDVAAARPIETTAIEPSFVAPRLAPQKRGAPIRAGPYRAAETCVRLQVFRC